MNLESLTLQAATMEDIPSVVALLETAARWLHNKGIQQWESPLPASFLNFMKDEARAGRVFTVRAGEGNEPIATFRIAYHDKQRWHDNGLDCALYVYSLALRNDLHGAGIGVSIIDAIKQRAAQEQRRWLRLDCWSLNSRLKRYYAALGFTEVGNIKDNGFPLTLFQVRITSGNRPSPG
jgi:RimJ/RimL family protein N-acetyltransferase